jgi:hypothetical protein
LTHDNHSVVVSNHQTEYEDSGIAFISATQMTMAMPVFMPFSAAC